MGNDLNKKKIRIYGDGQYLFTTTRHDTIKDAINAFKKGGDISVASIPGYKVNFNDYAKVTGEIVEELKEATDDRDGARYYIFDSSIGAFDDDYEEFNSKKDFLDSLAYNHSVAVDFEDDPDDLEEIRARFDSEDEHSEELNGFLYVKLTKTPLDKFLGEKLDEAKYPGWRHMTSTERRNARMNAIFTGKKDLDNAMKKYLLDLGVEPDRVDMLYRGDLLGKELVKLGKNADFFNRYDSETGTLREDKKKFECKKIVKESKDRPVYVITMYEKYPLYASEEGGYYYDGVEIIDQSDVFNSIDEAREALKKWAEEENFEYINFTGDYAADTVEHEYIGEGRFMQIESDDDDEFDDVASRESGRKFYESVERKLNFQKGDLKVGDTVKYGDEVSKIFDLEWDDDFGYDVLIRGKDGKKWWVGDNVEKVTKDIKEDKSNSDGTVEFDLNTNVYPVLNAGQYYTALELPDEAWFEDDDEKNEHNTKEWDRWILECAKPYIEDGLKETSDEIVLLDGLKYYHPNAYNFANDEIEFTVRLKEDLLNSLIEEYKNKPEFVEFLKKYRSYDGFWSDMASDLDEFNEQEKWKSLCQILAFNSLGDKKERQNFFEMDVLEGVGSGRADLFLNDWEEESLKEGVSKNMTPAEIAKKHNVPLDDIKNQLAKGIKVEKEHTDDEKKARRIALDHLFEIPDYYDRLGKMEKGALKESDSGNQEEIDRIEREIKALVKRYADAQKRYHGDSALSKRIEGEIDGLEIELRKLKGLKEDTIKTKSGKWVNKGKEGTHGEFKTKKAADAQRKAMFANKKPGAKWGESLDEGKDANPVIDRINKPLLKKLDEMAQDAYDGDYAQKKFDELYGWQLAALWSLCIYSEENPDGQLYDDEVYDAIAKRRDSEKLFDLSHEIFEKFFTPLGKDESLKEDAKLPNDDEKFLSELARNIETIKSSNAKSSSLDFGLDLTIDGEGYFVEGQVDGFKGNRGLEISVTPDYPPVPISSKYYGINDDTNANELARKILDDIKKAIKRFQGRDKKVNESMDIDEYVEWLVNIKGWDKDHAVEYAKLFYKEDGTLKEEVEDKETKETIRTPRGTFELYDGTYRDFKAEEDSEDWGLWFDHYYPDDVAWEDTEKWYKIFHNHVNNHAIAVLYKKLK